MDLGRIPFKVTGLANGDPASWEFTPEQKRLSLALPKEFGGKRNQVCLTREYTFTPITALQTSAY
ncbi:MAG: hypothetical protein AABN33_04775 [Acidobacteriota bacterium]